MNLETFVRWYKSHFCRMPPPQGVASDWLPFQYSWVRGDLHNPEVVGLPRSTEEKVVYSCFSSGEDL